MWFLMLGLLGLALKYFEVGPVGAWSWWVILVPFGLAVAWWTWADWSGYTKRRVMERQDQRRKERIDRQKANIGTLGPGSKGKR